MRLEERAGALALAHHPLGRPHLIIGPLIDSRRVSSAIARATREFRSSQPRDASFQKAGEWFLDNGYLVSRALRQVLTEVPAGFRRRLPYPSGDSLPRILRIAEVFLDETAVDFDEEALVLFVNAYQKIASLSIAELWAFPAMLRIATLDSLVGNLDTFFPPRGSKASEASAVTSSTALAPEVGIERAVRVLRLLGEVDWRTFVQRTSAVEAALRDDPLGVYGRMTFDSRDAYRKAVESLAWHTELTELDVARAAVALARQEADHAKTEDGRERHVGYYLLDAGLPRLKESIGYEAAGLQRLRDVALQWPTTAYLGSIALTSSVLLVAATIVVWRTCGLGSALVAAVLLAVPFVSVGVAWTNRWTGRLLVPRLLPKLDFANGVSVDCRTAVVIPGLVEHPSDFDRLLAQLELHYLSCPDPSLVFAVLSDHVDSSKLPDDTELLASARKTVDALNAKYGSELGGPFHVLHRRSAWNEGERSFMGWERKRGKLEELNRLLRGDTKTSYCEHIGAQKGLEGIRFVLTLDADTQLPVGTARRLIGLAAHPLNAARFDPSSGRVVCGYTVVQPRVEPSPVDGVNTLFGRLWCGDTALDIYSSAASDVYQDLFGAGAYVGKGIYEIDPFMRSLEGRVPANAIASHDLFEGIHGRAALATDIVVFEQYPQSYLSFLRRMHRWVRGDWQLFPWLLPRVPSADGGLLPNRLSAIDRWKIVDNLRRSLLGPCILALFFAGWALLPPVASALILVPLVVPLTLSVRAIFIGERRRTLGRWLLGVVFLPVEAAVTIDAIVRAVFRMTVTRKNLLQWVTAADAARTFSRGSRSLFWREMGTAVAVTTALGIVLGVSHPSALPFAAPLLLAWLVSPEIARWASAPETTRTTLEPSEVVEARRLARRTWLFFETFVGPTDQWLAPDNFQESPGAVIAHRTSPTNIGLMLVAELSAYDLGYIGRAELAALIGRSLDTLDRLERYRGHWLNWYDTRTLDPLLPRYVSTVDSGNLAGALVVMAEGCRQAAHLPAVRPRQLRGLGDALDLLADSLLRLSIPHDEANEPLATLRETLERAVEDEGLMGSVVGSLTAETLRLEAALLDLLARVVTVADVAIFREVQTWFDRFRHQTRSLDSDLATRAPDGLRDELLGLARRIDAARAGIDFAFLFDPERKLFHIGYNATSDRFDANHYDLLASEARLASFLAIVQGEVPSEHWLTLGRPVTRIRGGAALLSWGGTMFEFLMPTLLMRSQERTLLQQTSELIVAAQIAHGKRTGLPWGVSESGYAHLDAQGSYQYRSFGVPGLGLRRGLEEDSVVAPYACVLALRFRPREVLENVARLEKLGARGLYGLYEAVDYDASRAKEAARVTKRDPADHAIVRSYMAHHQGMILAALNNALNDDVLVDRFHSDPRTRIGEALLSERVPSVRLAEELVGPKKTVSEVASTVATYPSWTPDRTGVEMAVLGNGRLLTVVTDTGAGHTSWNGIAITREGLDSTCDVDGTWIYLRDEESGRTWSAAPAPTRPRLASDEIVFSAHRVELHHGDEGVSVRTQISVSPHDDVEVRTVKLHNEGAVARTLVLMTYAEPVLEPAAASAAHLAFSRLFVECERLPKQHGLLASRRLRSPEDPTAVVVQRLVWDDPSVTWLGSQTDRRAFVGRRRDARSPKGELAELDTPFERSTLDSSLVLAVRVKLAPGERVELALVTSVAATREEVLDVARRFGSLRAARWVAHDARLEVARRLEREGMQPALLPFALRLTSRLLAPRLELRAPALDLAGPLVSQSDLWAHGLSGDYPLLVVRVRDRAGNELVRDVLSIDRFLHGLGVKVGLVLLDDAITGYQADEPGSVRQLVDAAGAAGWLGQRGGVFVLSTDRLSGAERDRLARAARVLLDTANGSLAVQLGMSMSVQPPLPVFSATRAPEPAPATPLPALRLRLGSPYGGFTEDGREYVVRADALAPTPAPWCNVLANASAGCLVSESSLGVTWTINSGQNRITPWRNDPVSDVPSEVLYLRDEETAEVWSSTPLPAGMDVDTRVRHGAGFTTYERESHGMAQSLTVFVPVDDPVKIARITLTNRLPRARRLTATYYVEWTLGAQQEAQSHVVCELDQGAQCLLARSAWNADFAERVAFLASDRAIHGSTFDRTEFIGRSGTLAAPEALRRWGLSGTPRAGADPCAALQVHVGLAPGESATFHFVLGQGDNKAHALELANRFRSAAVVNTAFDALTAHWDELLGAVQVKTPEPGMDLLLNRWLLYQTVSSRLLARTAFYQSSGAFGYRDQLQDVMALTRAAPELARAHILVAAAHQFEEGDVMHWWHPPNDRGVRTRCSDDMAWLPFVTTHYVEATGDDTILDERVPFLKAPILRVEEKDRYATFDSHSEPATLREHCVRALDRARTAGQHGLPLIGDSDWNDGMNRIGVLGRGESVWLGFFLATALNGYARLCDRPASAKAERARDEGQTSRDHASALGATIDSQAWDGGWYLRAFYDDGTPLGTSRATTCRIDSIAQSWAVLSDVVDPERTVKALRAADELLVSDADKLVLVLAPPFDTGGRSTGYIQAYPRGIRENGGQYTHAATWIGHAYAHLGDGDRAERIFRLLDPILHAQSRAAADRYRIEPYVLAGDVYGVAPFVGRGGWSWYTGAAAWMWRLGVEAILGLKHDNGGLRVDPCIPSHWPGFEATVRVGKQQCHVTVDNSAGVGRGVLRATLDGVDVKDALVPLGSSSAPCELHVVLGSEAKAAE